ncbi:hypothetical protein [Nonomuraea sp. NPDC002799]
MRITLIVDEEHAVRLREQTGAELLGCLRRIGGHLRPVHPGTSDPVLSTFFDIEIPGTVAPQRAISELLNCQGVTAAYAKPADESP